MLNQWTKWIASTHLNYADPVPVLPFLNWTLLHNYGATFSFLSDAPEDGNAISSHLWRA
ncbi:signal peptidase II [Acinetobacter baumannii]